VRIESERANDRISIAMPVQVFGTEITGQDFFETTQTHMLSREGVAILLRHKLAPMQQVTLRNMATGAEATARIIGQMGHRPEGCIYGVTLLDSSLNLWKTNFPPQSEADKAVYRLLLECKACRGRELAYLGKIESQVFDANQDLTRHCSRCKESTVWRLAAHDFALEPQARDEAPQKAGANLGAAASRSKNNRKHTRVHMKADACVVVTGFGAEEIVPVEDISRGGLSFRTAHLHSLGSRIEVAAPFTKDAANFFVSARVVRTEEPGDKKARLYGVSYQKT
jgi:hypothetical protein